MKTKGCNVFLEGTTINYLLSMYYSLNGFLLELIMV